MDEDQLSQMQQALYSNPYQNMFLSQQTAPMQDTPEIKALKKKRDMQVEQSLGEQRQGVLGLQNQINSLGNAKEKPDLSALAGLTDSWTGSNLQQGYQKPMGNEERQKMLIQLQTQLQGQRGNLSDKEIDYTKAMLAEKLGQQKMQMAFNQMHNRPPSEKIGEHINDSQNALNDINGITDLINKNSAEMGPLKGMLAMNPYSKQAEIQAYFDRVKQTIGKLLEGGVLRKEDEAKYMKILPHVRDTPELALSKASQLQAKMQGDLANYQKNMQNSGYNMNAFGQLGVPRGAAPTQTSGPKAGLVENGFKFKGGNPADKNNWEQVQ